ncbi:hypothetical protein CFR76_13400 [Komagataeibacter swingsii]|uniref:Uncharacterized protein n=1 Tax=Komagataeibacter swingsii TaxID=215220 RepID=A0A2V4S0Z4_9PROT|nr:hypothetical protein CFR76_13400 [Komagataeibacter swingsii]
MPAGKVADDDRPFPMQACHACKRGLGENGSRRPLKSQQFLVTLFSKSFRERRFFGKRRHPETFVF